MVHKKLAVALSLLVFASPISAHAKPIAAPIDPTESADTRFCMRLAAFTGSRVETVRCWTRQQWTDQGVDLDKEWPREGVRVIRRT